MDLMKLLIHELYCLYGLVDIMRFEIEDDVISAHFSYMSNKSMMFANCKFNIIKSKSFFGRIKTKLQIIEVVNH